MAQNLGNFRVYFNSTCKRELTPDAIFPTLEDAVEYIKARLPKMREFITDGQVYTLRPFEHRITVTRVEVK